MMRILRTWRFFLPVVLLFCGVLILPLSAQADPTFVHAARPDLPDVARGVPMGGALRVFGLTLDGVGEVSLELERFAVFASDAKIEVVSASGTFEMKPPTTAYFRGHVENDPDSAVMFSVSESKPMRGVIASPSGLWLLKEKPGMAGLQTRMVDTATELADRKFECGVDDQSLTPNNISANGLSASSEEAEALGMPTNVQRTAHMIIDTDYEYWLNFWNIYNPDVNETATQALEYLGDLLAYASTPYEREVYTNLRIQYARLFADNTDPYASFDTSAGCDTDDGPLDEVQAQWSGNPTPRTLVHLLSGKPGGGCGYTGTDYSGVLCAQDKGYAASMGIGTGFDIDNPGFTYEGFVIAHEIGHNFGSRHTHDYCDVYDNPNPVDVCEADNCLSAAADFPGLGSLTGGNAADHPGTIMSYCGPANVSHTFGLYHPYGIAAWRVPTWMNSVAGASAACMTLDYGGADLRVFKDCKPDDPMLVGDTATCTITVQNHGPSMALGVTAVDEYLSSGTFFFGSIIVTKGVNTFTDMCDTSDPNPDDEVFPVTCNLGDIASGHSAVIEIPVTANEPQNINDSVSVASDSVDPDMTNNMATDEVNVVEIADLEVFKDCKPDEPLLAGQPGICTIIVKNWGPSTARSVTLRDAHVSNGTFNFGSITETQGTCSQAASNPQVEGGEVNCNLGDLAAGAEATVVVELLTDEGQNINDTAIASSDSYDPDINNNSAGDGVGVEPVADLEITKLDNPNPVTAGNQLTYDLTVTNNGPSTAVNVVIADVLPAGVTIVSVSSPDGECNAGVPGDGLLPTTCTVDSLADSSSATMQIVVTVEPQTLGILGNNAKVYSDLFDPDNSNNLATTATTVEASADLSVVKSDHPDPVLAGEYLTYNVTIANAGPSTAVDVMLTDALPSQVSFDGYIVSNGSGTCVPLEGSTNVECDLNDLNPGEFVTVFIKVLVDPSVPHGTTITDTATVSAVTPDPDITNNSVSEDTLVNAEADLIISKDADFLDEIPSKEILYTVEVTNAGPSDALAVVMVDQLPLDPKKIVYVMDSGNGACSYDDTTHMVTCNFGTLAAGDSVSVDIVVEVNGSVRRITNTANVTTSTTDPDPSNNLVLKEINVKGTGDGGPKEGQGKTCRDGIDNDSDGLIDCADPGCAGHKDCP